jgi:hypothetical protein
MVKKREERRGEGKNTIFWCRRRQEGPLQLVPDDKVDRIADRYSHDLNAVTNGKHISFKSRCQLTSIGVQTPENIEYSTPDDHNYSRAMSAARRPAPTSTPRHEYPFPSVHSSAMNGISGTTLPPMHSMTSVSALHGMTSQAHSSAPSMPTALTQSMMANGIGASAHPAHHSEGGHYYQDEAPVPSYIGHHQPSTAPGWDPWQQARW